MDDPMWRGGRDKHVPPKSGPDKQVPPSRHEKRAISRVASSMSLAHTPVITGCSRFASAGGTTFQA